MEPDPGNAGVGNECRHYGQVPVFGPVFFVSNNPKNNQEGKKMNRKSHLKLRCLAECAIFVAMSVALSYLKIPIGLEFGGFGGSIDLVMIPLIIAAFRWGLGWGLGSGLVFGTLKFFLAGGVAINWQSMLLDYSIAYMFVGFAGLLKRKNGMIWLAALIGCICRFVVHFVSGITIYAEYMEDIFGLHMTNVWVYSALYNGSYMLPNTIIAILVCILLSIPLKKYLNGEDLK
jgi:thiamine transporter